ncbi:hypothetical protein ABBQ38_012540 [Trebouxia sp. C0009 RCD-2024]
MSIGATFVAVHVGSGMHSRTNEKVYLEALASACQAASSASNCMTGVSQAIKALEEAEVTNAGLGSNLTLDGSVEADASIMLGDKTFAAVGAAPGLGSAIEAASLLARESQQPLPLGRVRPIFLAGQQAWVWAKTRGLTTASSLDDLNQWHVSGRAQKQWKKYKHMIDQDAERQTHHQQRLGATKATASQLASSHAAHTAQLTALGGQTYASHEANANSEAVPCMHGSKRSAATSGSDSGSADGSHRAKQQRREEGRSSQHAMPGLQHRPSQEGMSLATLQQESDLDDSCLNDTVGAVFIDPAGRVGAGVSSGGIAMKTPGRVGEAAMYACGCWAVDADPPLDRSHLLFAVQGLHWCHPKYLFST